MGGKLYGVSSISFICVIARLNALFPDATGQEDMGVGYMVNTSSALNFGL